MKKIEKKLTKHCIVGLHKTCKRRPGTLCGQAATWRMLFGSIQMASASGWAGGVPRSVNNFIQNEIESYIKGRGKLQRGF